VEEEIGGERRKGEETGGGGTLEGFRRVFLLHEPAASEQNEGSVSFSGK